MKLLFTKMQTFSTHLFNDSLSEGPKPIKAGHYNIYGLAVPGVLYCLFTCELSRINCW